jgi:hypothetical protein
MGWRGGVWGLQVQLQLPKRLVHACGSGKAEYDASGLGVVVLMLRLTTSQHGPMTCYAML